MQASTPIWGEDSNLAIIAENIAKLNSLSTGRSSPLASNISRAGSTSTARLLLLKQLRYQGGDAAAFGASQRHMSEECITFEDLHNCPDAIVATDS